MPEAVDTVIAAARAFLGERITTNATLREHHSHGQDTQPPVLPDAVAFVETSDEAARLLALCNNARVPVVAWGAGTSLEGHVTPVRGGITLDLSHMTRIIEVSQPDKLAKEVHALVKGSSLDEMPATLARFRAKLKEPDRFYGAYNVRDLGMFSSPEVMRDLGKLRGGAFAVTGLVLATARPGAGSKTGAGGVIAGGTVDLATGTAIGNAT